MRANLRGREGFALGITVMALLVAGALIGVLFWGAMVEAWAGRAVGEAARARAAADAGWEATLAGWASLGADTVGPGWRLLGGVPIGAGASATVRLRRLNRRLFLVESAGEVGPGSGVGSRRTVVVLVDSDSGSGAVRSLPRGPWWFGLSPW